MSDVRACQTKKLCQPMRFLSAVAILTGLKKTYKTGKKNSAVRKRQIIRSFRYKTPELPPELLFNSP